MSTSGTVPLPRRNVITSYPLHKIKVVLLENVHPRARALLQEAGYNVQVHETALQNGELLDVAGDAHMVGIRSKTQLDAAFFQNARPLWAVGCFCIGTNQVDLEAAAARGVSVFNSPFSSTRSVAEMTIAAILALQRNLFDASTGLHAGTWQKSARGRREVRGKTLGIVGYGRIGSQVSVLAEALGMRVLFYDVVDVLPLGNAEPAPTLEALLERSDVVTLHVPSTPVTRGMIGADEIASMKSGAMLVNYARGDVVRQAELAAALRDGYLGGAAVDVYDEEPDLSNCDGFTSPLQGAPNTLLTPHIGGSTEEAQARIAEDGAQKLIRFMNNGTTSGSVNLPQVELPRIRTRKRRILHYHHNVPGVMSALHAVLADREVNVDAEFMRSTERFGYAILDVDSGQAEPLKRELKGVEGTIRVRTLW